LPLNNQGLLQAKVDLHIKALLRLISTMGLPLFHLYLQSSTPFSSLHSCSQNMYLVMLKGTQHVNLLAEGYSACRLIDIHYPIWSNDHQQSYCGLPKFKLHCQQDNVTIDMMSQRFHVIDIDQTSKVLKMARLDLWDDPCTNEHSNVKLDSYFFNYTSKEVLP